MYKEPQLHIPLDDGDADNNRHDDKEHKIPRHVDAASMTPEEKIAKKFALIQQTPLKDFWVEEGYIDMDRLYEENRQLEFVNFFQGATHRVQPYLNWYSYLFKDEILFFLAAARFSFFTDEDVPKLEKVMQTVQDEIRRISENKRRSTKKHIKSLIAGTLINSAVYNELPLHLRNMHNGLDLSETLAVMLMKVYPAYVSAQTQKLDPKERKRRYNRLFFIYQLRKRGWYDARLITKKKKISDQLYDNLID